MRSIFHVALPYRSTTKWGGALQPAGGRFRRRTTPTSPSRESRPRATSGASITRSRRRGKILGETAKERTSTAGDGPERVQQVRQRVDRKATAAAAAAAVAVTATGTTTRTTGPEHDWSGGHKEGPIYTRSMPGVRFPACHFCGGALAGAAVACLRSAALLRHGEQQTAARREDVIYIEAGGKQWKRGEQPRRGNGSIVQIANASSPWGSPWCTIMSNGDSPWLTMGMT